MSHQPVMLSEVMAALSPRAGEMMVDGTFGAGGYTRAILATGAQVVAFDRDRGAARFAAGLPADRFTLVCDTFSNMEHHVAAADGVTLDIGVSSMQLDESERGFSFLRDGPLDMRMGDRGPTAADIVNTYGHGALAHLFKVYGEEPAAGRIATFILRRREEAPFARTLELAETVERAVGGRKGAKIHPATRVFQALRIAVNDELGELEAGLAAAERILREGGRLAVVTFHSLEDRIVKAFFADRSGRRSAGSRHLPPREAGPAATFTPLFRGHREPSAAEMAGNPRARSAKLRAGVRTAAPPLEAAA